MIEIPSALEGKTFLLNVLEQELKPLGYVIGGNWDYDHGSFDYKMADDVGYQFYAFHSSRSMDNWIRMGQRLN